MAELLIPAERLESGSDPSVIVNDNAYRLEVINLPASSFEATEPGSPTEGELVVLSGSWGDGDAEDLGYYCDGAWSFWTPFEGLIKVIAGSTYRFESGAWELYVVGGLATVAIQYTADLGSTADSDPGAGLLKWNNATQGSATELYLDDTTADGVSLTGIWAALASGGFLYLQHATDQDVYQIRDISGVVDAAGYAKLAGTVLAKSAADFVDGDPMLVTIQQGASSSAVTDGTYGDITVSGSGATWTIANNAVTTAKVINGAITLAKMADMATASLIGRNTAGTGVPEVLSASTAKSLLSLNNVTNDAQTKAAVVPNTAPTAGQILVGNAGGTAYAPVSASGDATIGASGAVTIANDAVTLAKMANVATGTVFYRKTAATGDPEVQTLATLKTDLGIAADIAAAGATVSTLGKQAIYIHANSMVLPISGASAARGQVASGAGMPDIVSCDFDPTTQEYAQVSFVPPKKWNGGTITFIAHWSHAATTTNFGVAIGLQGVAISDDDTIGLSWGTGVVVTDTGGTTDDLYTTAESAAVTLAGTPAKQDMVFLRIFRQVANGADTMAIDMRLLGLTLLFVTDASTDA